MALKRPSLAPHAQLVLPALIQNEGVPLPVQMGLWILDDGSWLPLQRSQQGRSKKCSKTIESQWIQISLYYWMQSSNTVFWQPRPPWSCEGCGLHPFWASLSLSFSVASLPELGRLRAIKARRTTCTSISSICASDRAPDNELGSGGGGSEPPRIRGGAFHGILFLAYNKTAIFLLEKSQFIMIP